MIKNTTLVFPGAGAGAGSRSRNFGIPAPAPAPAKSFGSGRLRLRNPANQDLAQKVVIYLKIEYSSKVVAEREYGTDLLFSIGFSAF
jgi:hypothetical protein